MSRYRWQVSLLLGAVSGILLSFLYVNPYGGEISLEELVLQLSGSRGDFALGTHLTEFLDFMIRMLPGYLFELYFGISFYRQFCAASVYVFSRRPERVKWYGGEVLLLLGNAFLFQAVLLGACVLVAACRFQVIDPGSGIRLLGCHLFLHSLWICTMAVLVNLLALSWGSSTAFGVVIGIQTVCVTLFGIEKMLGRLGVEILPQMRLVNLNSMAGLVLGWHVGNQGQFLLTGGILFGVVTAIGAVVVKRHDLLLSDAESGM